MRVVPAVITVNSLADTNTFDPGGFSFPEVIPPGTRSDNFLTFREAVSIVNAGTTFGYSSAEAAQVSTSNGALGVNDTIHFAPGLTSSGAATIMMVNGEYLINEHVKINGPGADKLSFDAGQLSRIFKVDTGIAAEISGLTLKNGKVTTGDGGVIHNSGFLKLTGVTIQGGQAEVSGGGIFNRETLSLERTTITGSFAILGGGIENQGALTVNQSTFEGNAARFGGGIHNDGNTTLGRGVVSVTNSTFASNVASPEFLNTFVSGLGGGIDNQRGAVTVVNSTFVGNSAVSGGVISAVNPGARGGAINNQDRLSVIHSTITGNTVSAFGGGAGVFGKVGALTTRLVNSILVGNTVGSTTTLDDLSGQLRGEVFGDTFGNLISQPNIENRDLLATVNYFPETTGLTESSFVPSNVFESQTLAFNGGLTKTLVLKGGSPAIDKAITDKTIKDAKGTVFSLASNSKDQRGGAFSRAYRQPDLGAVEFIPQTLVVDTLADDNNGAAAAVTLREAVNLANAISGDNTITFAPTLTGTIKLTNGELALTDTVGTLKIQGPGPTSLAIDGNQRFRVFNVGASTKAEIAGLTIQNGNAGTSTTEGSGGGIAAGGDSVLTVKNATFKNNRAVEGGGIFSSGTLVVGGSTFEGNVADLSGGGISAIVGVISVFDSTFLQNVANGTGNKGGGGIAVLQSTARIENCTFVGNQAVGVGGGIFVLPGARIIEIVHCTLTANTVVVEPGTQPLATRTADSRLNGGGLFVEAPSTAGRVAVVNTIVAGNFVAHSRAATADYGGNEFGSLVVNDHSLIGGDASKIFGSGLVDLGGPTKTIPLRNDSTVTAAANLAFGKATPLPNVLTDQRGFVRSSTAPSIGAFEPTAVPTLLVTTTTDEDNGTISPKLGKGTSLREALNLAGSLSGPSTITFAADMTGVIELTLGTLVLDHATSKKITIQGPGADKLAIDGSKLTPDNQGSRRLLLVPTGEFAEISGLTLQTGLALGDGGGAILNLGNLTLRGIKATANTSDFGGGAIHNVSNSVLTLENSTISGNGTLSGGGNRLAGGLLNEGILIVRGSTFSGNSNSANNTGAGGTGGGIANYGTAFIVNSTFAGNFARVSGGAIHNEGTLFLANDTITNNFSAAGAGLFTTATFAKSTAVNTILVGNFKTPDPTSPSLTELNVGGKVLATESTNNLTTGAVADLFETGVNDVPQLANNGGPTQTIALKSSSPAINAGTDLKTLLTNFKTQSGLNFDVDAFAAADQRGGTFNRVFNDSIDLGAFEINVPTSLAASVTSRSENVFPNVLWFVDLKVENTSNLEAKNVIYTIPLPADVEFVGLTQSSGPAATTVTAPTVGANGTVEVKFNSLPANTAAAFLLQLGPRQSAAGKTLSIAPTLKQSSSGTETSTPLELTVKPLPTLPAITAINTVGSATQTSVGRPVTFQLTVPTTSNDGPQRAKLDVATVTAADFMNSGTATATINSVTVTEANDVQTVSVQMTPNNAGTLGLAFKNPFDIKDNLGRAVTSPIPTLSPIDVSAELLVDSASDVDDGNLAAGQFTLREAIRLAQEAAGNDTIKFASNLGAITLTTELLLNDTTGTVSIFGPSGGTQVIQRATDDTNSFRLFQIASGSSAAFRSLTLANGKSTGNGGAILNLGTLDIDQSTLRNNSAAGQGGAIFNNGGSDGSLRLHRSTLSGNSANDGGALGNENGSTLTADFVTISGNSALSNGGGIYNVGNLTLTQATVALNQADSDGINGGDSGGLAAFNIENISNSLFAGNVRGADDFPNDIGGGFVDVKKFNVIADNASGGGITSGEDGNVVGINGGSSIPLASIFNTTLANNGGPTQTHALVPFSPARDAGPDSNGFTADQRGQLIKGVPDIGAFEYQPTTASVTLASDTRIFVVPGRTLVLTETLTGNGNLTKIGFGTLALTGNNTYKGQTFVSQGTLLAAHNNAFGTATGSKGTIVAPDASVAVAQGVTVPEALVLSRFGFDQTGALRMIVDSSVPNLPNTNTSTWSGPITLEEQSSVDVGTDGQLTITGVISGSVGSINPGITKIGAGKLILRGNNTYPGLTLINDGGLSVNGTQTSSSFVINGGTLFGVGTTGTTSTQDDSESRIAPGNSVGKLLSKGNFALGNNTTLDVEINGSAAGTRMDNVDVTGTVTLNDATLLATLLPGFASKVGNKYQIITNDGTDAVIGTFNGLAEGATVTINGQAFTITYKGGTGNDVVLTHVNTAADFRNRSITPVVGENGIATLKGTIVEVDPLDTFKLIVQWGDGQSQTVNFPAGSNGKLVTLTHKYVNGRVAPYNVTLKWEDSNKAVGTAQLAVQVFNVAPTATISGPTTFKVNSLSSFTFSATDPADQSSNMTWNIDWGDGTTETLTKASHFRHSHKYTQPGNYLIRATATDRDGQISGVTTLRVTVLL